MNMALKLSTFVVQRANIPQNGVLFSKKSIGNIMFTLVISYDVW